MKPAAATTTTGLILVEQKITVASAVRAYWGSERSAPRATMIPLAATSPTAIGAKPCSKAARHGAARARCHERAQMKTSTPAGNTIAIVAAQSCVTAGSCGNPSSTCAWASIGSGAS
jgi:hypothetical protein